MKYIIIKTVLTALAYLPLSVLRLIGSFVGKMSFKYSKKATTRLINNLTITKIGGDLAYKTAIEIGKTLVETICIAWHRSTKYNSSLVKTVINEDLLIKAQQQSKPIILLTPHIGNFEVGLKYVASVFKRNITVLYKPNKDKTLNKLMLQGRGAKNVIPVATTRYGIATLVRALKNNESIGILPDNVASEGEGVWIKFFGQDMFATTLSAKLILNTDANVIIVNSYRMQNGFTVEYIPFNETTKNIQTTVQEIYIEIEKMVLNNPTEYYWSYDRFRRPTHARGK